VCVCVCVCEVGDSKNRKRRRWFPYLFMMVLVQSGRKSGKTRDAGERCVCVCVCVCECGQRRPEPWLFDVCWLLAACSRYVLAAGVDEPSGRQKTKRQVVFGRTYFEIVVDPRWRNAHT
jgi:hypothetical protein